jgi:Mg2+/Co2+ transporter CorB
MSLRSTRSVLPFSVFATAEVATKEANITMVMMVFMEVSPDCVAAHTVSDVRLQGLTSLSPTLSRQIVS